MSQISVTVGGIPYVLDKCDLLRHPGSFFESIVLEEVKTIDRDGSIFKLVNAFLVTGQLPRDAQGTLTLDEVTLEQVKTEAVFYGLPSLTEECNIICKAHTGFDLPSIVTIKNYLEYLKKHAGEGDGSAVDCAEKGKETPLIRALLGVWSPFCLTGKIDPQIWRGAPKFFKQSHFCRLLLSELEAEAVQSAYGHGTDTVTDTTVRNSLEIEAKHLDPYALQHALYGVKVTSLACDLSLELRPYKLVIYKDGGHFHEHRDTVRGEGHIGTIVVILNSEYTGGELEVSHGGRTEIVTGAYSWVAMYGDCLHKINPVTSGTRVSLIYNIYGHTDKYLNPQRGVYTYSEDFWYIDHNQQPIPSDRARGITADTSTAILNALQDEFVNFDTITIALQHLYPECQTNPAFLKGGDRALYNVLCEQYNVQVVAATILKREELTRHACLIGTMFNSTIVKATLESVKNNHSVPVKKQKHAHTHTRTKIVLPLLPDHDHYLDYSPYADYTGNESAAEETVYIVAALQVQQK